eukprot:Selendium_serpulae@DN5208_c0_g1_i2.p1
MGDKWRNGLHDNLETLLRYFVVKMSSDSEISHRSKLVDSPRELSSQYEKSQTSFEASEKSSSKRRRRSESSEGSVRRSDCGGRRHSDSDRHFGASDNEREGRSRGRKDHGSLKHESSFGNTSTDDDPKKGSFGESSGDDNKRRRRRTGWDDLTTPAIPAGLDMTAQKPVLGPHGEVDGAQFADRQLQAANIAAQMQSKASMSQACRIYVGSLDYSLTEADLRQVLEPFGTIVNIDMPKEGNRSKGFCFVEYTSPEAAEMVLNLLQGFDLKGRPIKVGRPTAMGGIPKETTTTSPSTPNVDPAAAGILAAASLMANRGNSQAGTPTLPGVNGGAGSIGTLATPPPAVGLPTGLTPQQMFGTGPSPHAGLNRIYVGSVPYGFSAEEVKQIFQVFGSIISCQLIPSNERPGTHRGYGFIEYQTVEEARLAIATMNGFEVSGKQLKVNHATALRNTGPTTPALSTPTLLQQLALQAQTPAADAAGPQITIPELSVASPGASCAGSRILMLTNMVESPEKVDDDLKDELQTECSKYGDLHNVTVKIIGSEVRVFLEFATTKDATQAIPPLHGRWFDGRQIVCRQYDEASYSIGLYNL